MAVKTGIQLPVVVIVHKLEQNLKMRTMMQSINM